MKPLLIAALLFACNPPGKSMTHWETYVWSRTINGCVATYDPVYCAQYADIVVHEYRMRGE